MAQRACRSGLLLESADSLGVVRAFVRNDLEGDVAMEPAVAAAVDLPHAARAEWREDLVGAQLGAGGESHGGSLHEKQGTTRARIQSRESL